MNIRTYTDATPQIPVEILLNDLQKQVHGQMVDIVAKVLDVSDVTYSRKDNITLIQKVGISDESASATATLWGNFTSQVQIGHSYPFRLAVKSGLDDDMVLYTSKNGCEIKPVQDIGQVAPLTHFKKETHNLFKNANARGSDSSTDLIPSISIRTFSNERCYSFEFARYLLGYCGTAGNDRPQSHCRFL